MTGYRGVGRPAGPRRIGRSDASVPLFSGSELTAIAAGVVVVTVGLSWLVAATFPTAARLWMFALLVVASLAAEAGVVAWFLRRAQRRDATQIPRGLATAGEVLAQSGAQRARAKAGFQRSSMSADEIATGPLEALALQLGSGPDGTTIWAPMEDQIVIVGKTGSGKGAFYVAPAALSAPGPVVVTTTRADVIDVIATRRSEVGRVWVFDPLDLAHWPDPMTWDPLVGCERDDVARARGRAFVAALGRENGGNTQFFKDTSGAAIQYMVHAAALGRLGNKPELSMSDVCTWAMRLDNGAQYPQDLIRRSTHPRAERLWADMLQAVATGADDTVASTRVTLRGALDAISSGSVLNCIIPKDGRANFDVRSFVRSRDTLVLVSDANSLTNVAPLTTMLLQEVFDVGKEIARTLPNGLLDPPLRIVGDEIANVAPIENLPEMFTDSRGYGFQIVAFFQSVAQAVARWGRERGGNLLAQAGYEVVLPGLKDAETLDRYSQLVGSIDVGESTMSVTASGEQQSSSYSVREQRILRPEEVRKLRGDRSALLVPALGEPMILTLTPWWEGTDGAALTMEAQRVARQRAAQALQSERAESPQEAMA